MKYMQEVKMKLVISYDKALKKVMMKLGEEKEKELSFDELLLITNNVIDKNETYELQLIGFEENPDVEKNYKEIFDEILKLKDDPEIQDLKSKIINGKEKEL